METSVQQKFYSLFKEAVKKRTVYNMAVPISGGLDSTLIVKALHDNGDLDQCKFICMGENDYAKQVAERYGIEIHFFEPEIQEGDMEKVIRIMEEPFYSPSVNYYLYKEIHYMNCRVSISGLGADELFGGYDYYGTEHYPRGLFEEIVAKTDQEKRDEDIYFLTYHHLRENDKIGLHWRVEGRYPFLDKAISELNDTGKSLIKSALLEDFPEEFVHRKKEGFSLDQNKDRDYQRKEYLKQLDLWMQIYG